MGVSNPHIQATLLGDAVEGAPVAVFVADENRRYIAVNAYACEMLGYSREELLALRVTEVAVHDTADAEYEEMVREGTRTGTAELRRKDGTTVSFRYRAGSTRVAAMLVYVSVGYPER
jgi:PAS domain S-box-containing protein